MDERLLVNAAAMLLKGFAGIVVMRSCGSENGFL